jgi:hypothetical protein
VWELVEPPTNCKPNGVKWVWKNKEGENGEVVRNKLRPVAQGYSQKEGINNEETFAPVARDGSGYQFGYNFLAVFLFG